MDVALSDAFALPKGGPDLLTWVFSDIGAGIGYRF